MRKKYSQIRSGTALGLPFKIGAPSMVFGKNLLENVYRLADLVDHVEVVLFYTPTLHNFPSATEIKTLRKLGANEDVSFSVHLPAFLEIASGDLKKRETAVRMVVDLVNLMDEINPVHHILHIPFNPPTLAPIPGRYLTIEHQDKFIEWNGRAGESLETIQSKINRDNEILIENIDYSPIFLERFWKMGLCGFCLDIGHLMLGRENVSGVTKQFMSVIREIHLHGVIGYEEHLSLTVLPQSRVSKWVKILLDAAFMGVVNLEVFSEQCLDESLDMLINAFQSELGDFN